jgi:hypothetical protein
MSFNLISFILDFTNKTKKSNEVIVIKDNKYMEIFSGTAPCLCTLSHSINV